MSWPCWIVLHGAAFTAGALVWLWPVSVISASVALVLAGAAFGWWMHRRELRRRREEIERPWDRYWR